jgi:hypothetical protein
MRTQTAAKRVAGKRVALEQAEGILDRVDQWPPQVEEVAMGSAREDESRQGSVGVRASSGRLLAQPGRHDRLTALDLA